MHVAIIMNGNGRWALRRGLPATAGRMESAAALRTTVELALRAGVKTLSRLHLRIVIDYSPHDSGLHRAECLWPDFTAHHFQRALGLQRG
jgi:undecaprenyl pyrophosphate synthase